jgi:hypothetical protein
MFCDVASDFASSTALASLGGSSFHSPRLDDAVEASDGRLAFVGLGFGKRGGTRRHARKC